MATRILNLIEPLIIEEWDPHQIANWLERLEVSLDLYLFDISDKLTADATEKAEKMEALSNNILISSIGPHTHKLLKSYCQPKKLTDFKFEELKKVLVDELSPTTINYVNEQFKFKLLKQEATEPLSRFITLLFVW